MPQIYLIFTPACIVAFGKVGDVFGEAALSSRKMVADNLGTLTIFDVPHRDTELKTGQQNQPILHVYLAHKIDSNHDTKRKKQRKGKHSERSLCLCVQNALLTLLLLCLVQEIISLISIEMETAFQRKECSFVLLYQPYLRHDCNVTAGVYTCVDPPDVHVRVIQVGAVTRTTARDGSLVQNGWMDGWMNQAYTCSRLSTTHGHITDCKLLVCMYWTRLVLSRMLVMCGSPLLEPQSHPRGDAYTGMAGMIGYLQQPT